MSAFLTSARIHPIIPLVEDIYSKFGKRLRELRTSAGMTQVELADKIGLGRTSITNIEKGIQPVSLLILYELAQALNLEPQKLLPAVPAAPLEERFEKHIVHLDDDEKSWVRKIVLKTEARKQGSDGNT